MLQRRKVTGLAALAALFLATTASAGDPTGHDLPAEPEAPAPTTPPVLRTRADPKYPPQALHDHVEGTVTLELDVDEVGRVKGARVLTPAGHGFDEAILAAASQFTFTPATQSGRAVPSIVQLAYEFHLPPASAPAPDLAPAPALALAPAPALAPSPSPSSSPSSSTLVLARRPTPSSSSLSISDRDFSLRPIGSVTDILRATPGLVMVQHSGGGKANQYFLRGFDADHGTDIALSVDGVPINMPSHAHGQGYADTNFIIPEAVERLEITKGPYFANQGDFATAGAVNLVTRDSFDHSSIGFGFSGSPGYGGPGYRGLLIASPRWDGATAMFAAEVGHADGPFESPENWDKYKIVSKLTISLAPASTLSLVAMSYGGTWHGSGQIPARAVEQGTVGRFGSLDPSEGGDTTRHQVHLQYVLRPNEDSELRTLLYLGAYTFDLFSDFTYFLVDPVHGDEIEQQDRRTFYGAKLSYRVVHAIGPLRSDTTVGADVRADDIHEALWHTRDRVQLAAVRDDATREALLGAYASEELSTGPWGRVVLGLRADGLAFSVEDNLTGGSNLGSPRSGTDGAHLLSPKASAVLAPLRDRDARLEVYLNWGNGYHSNDVRGVFATPSVTPLTRAMGEEVGARARLLEKVDLAATGWLLDLDSETTWDGDAGTTVVGPATRRYGVELEGRYEILPWLAADGAVTLSHSQFSADHENGGGLALAPKQTWSGGVSARRALGPGVARAALRFYGIGDRPASDDGLITAPGFTQVDVHLGYRTRRWDLALDVENFFDGDYRSAQFDTVTRLQTDPPIGTPLGQVPAGLCGSNGRLVVDPATRGFGGCEGVSFTPAYPRTLRLMATLYLD